MKFSRREKILQRIMPYWCPITGRRFFRKSSFEKHYMKAKYRQDMLVDERLRRVAPENREQRRAMAKKAGQIKDWKDLNGSHD